MAKLVRLTSELRADFVAYLDGELDEVATARIESVIAQSEVARSEMEALAGTYELLDELERPQASDDFAERTMATIRVDQLRPDPRDSWWYRGGRSGAVVVAWGIALLGTALVGYLAANRWWQTPADRMVAELPLIEQLDLYREVGSIEFLQRLSTHDALLQEMSPEQEPRSEQTTRSEPTTNPEPKEVVE